MPPLSSSLQPLRPKVEWEVLVEVEAEDHLSHRNHHISQEAQELEVIWQVKEGQKIWISSLETKHLLPVMVQVQF